MTSLVHSFCQNEIASIIRSQNTNAYANRRANTRNISECCACI